MSAVALAVLFFPCVGSGFAENLSEQVRGHIIQRIEAFGQYAPEKSPRFKSALLNEFYRKTEFFPVWSDEGILSPQIEPFVEILVKAGCEGLRTEDYHLADIQKMLSELVGGSRIGPDPQDSDRLADFDILMTDALLTYASHLVDGCIDHQIIYPGWVVSKEPFDRISHLLDAVESGEVKKCLADLSPRYPGYAKRKGAMIEYQHLAENPDWRAIPDGPKMTKGSRDRRVSQLRQRLLALKDLHTMPPAAKDSTVFDDTLEAAVRRFQKRNGLKADGRVGRSTLDVLNVPLKKRLRQIALNMDRLRWLSGTSEKHYIVVNIADFSLQVIDDGRVAMSMKIIAGKTEQRSCILSRKMTYLELNPYWRVPDSIAVKEILPLVRRNPGYLAEKKIRVFKDWADNMKEIDPRKVKWPHITADDLTYKFRQDPGPSNPLGRIKFIFPNECEIYLHDTPKRYLFDRTRRDFSHGCIRIEKPIDLAVYLLRNKETWTQNRILAEIKTEKRQVVVLPDPIDVYIIYGTAWVDQSGSLQFRDDVYHIDDTPYEETTCGIRPEER